MNIISLLNYFYFHKFLKFIFVKKSKMIFLSYTLLLKYLKKNLKIYNTLIYYKVYIYYKVILFSIGIFKKKKLP